MREPIRLWIEALRNPEAKQAKGGLTIKNDDGSHKGDCCLGVACKITPGIVAYGSGFPAMINRLKVAYDEEINFLPLAARRWLGLKTKQPAVRLSEGNWVYLNDLNDDDNATFAQIADIIEEQDENWDGTRREARSE